MECIKWNETAFKWRFYANSWSRQDKTNMFWGYVRLIWKLVPYEGCINMEVIEICLKLWYVEQSISAISEFFRERREHAGCQRLWFDREGLEPRSEESVPEVRLLALPLQVRGKERGPAQVQGKAGQPSILSTFLPKEQALHLARAQPECTGKRIPKSMPPHPP